MLTFNSIMNSNGWKSRNNTHVFLGLNNKNQVVTRDLSAMPHLLIAGTTGSGKSVLMHSIICSLFARNTDEQLQFVFIDPKFVELNLYKKLKHNTGLIASESYEIHTALSNVYEEMQRRYRLLAEHNCRNLNEFKQKHWQISTIVVVIDELADLVLESKENEKLIVRLAQKARAAGIHLIIATQRPDARTLSGLLRSNIPARIALKVQKSIESRIIIDECGAEKLRGKGDMLVKIDDKSMRLQGVYQSDDDLIKFISKYSGYS